MNIPGIIIAAVIAAVFLAIVGRGVYNWKHRKGGCGCGCRDCPSRDLCRPSRQDRG